MSSSAAIPLDVARPAGVALRCTLVLAAAALVALLLAPAHAHAQDDAEKGRVLLAFTGSANDIATLEAAAARFQGPVLELTDVRFAGDKEKDKLYAACGADLGVSAETRRDCQLAAANRAYVAQVLEISAQADGKNAWELTLQVWDPIANELIYTSVTSVPGKTLKLAARDGLATLAQQYVCWRGIERACGASLTGFDTGRGRLEISDVTPSPVTVLVNGVELGPAPNHFRNLPIGEVTLTLRQAGYKDLTRTIALAEDAPLALAGLALEPLPSVLEVTVNAENVPVFIDGQRRGTVGRGGVLEIAVDSGELQVAVGGGGWTVHRERVRLSPGARHALKIELEDAAPYVASCASARAEAAETPCSRACEAGDAASCARLGAFLYSGETGSSDFPRARLLFEAACRADHVEACNNLGFMLEKGQGGERDLERAHTLYRGACDSGAQEACFNLGVMLQRGNGVAADPATARDLFAAACDRAEGRACYQLGDMLFRGDGVSADAREAAVFFERACDAGTPGGCTNLAFLLESGQIDTDIDRAVKLYQRACDAGEPGACYNLGYLLAAGEKVARDVASARTRFDQACALGLQNACLALQQLP